MEAWQIMRFQKHRLVFVSMMAISAFVWLQMAIYLLHEVFGLRPKWNLLQYCVAAVSEQTVLNQIVLIGLNGIMAYSIGMIIWFIGQQAVMERRWLARMKMNRHNRLSKQLNRKYRSLGYEITVIRHDSMLALTFGFIRPRILVSTALLSNFTEREMDAIVLHEVSHCRNYDPLRLLLVKMMKDSLPFIPVLHRMSHYIEVWVELEADRYAIEQMKSPIDLANVLLRYSRFSQRSLVGVGFADEAINYRLQQLIEPKSKIRVPILNIIPLSISSLMIFIISNIFVSGCA
ncbi:M56 family metallopeptidase [Paenibacillus spongiae]|uniref:M56 family metallopeptidase n=1 Tax=Paenibacillus spongiae TaxID=2909671 RepID=A0ABY5SC95_9BACL|nr:M56 family metallopeptidase [Paenibacillus spongiae]UVI31148.1 M56 family metallopeptidase [Paenibacillus spongiae]